MNGSLEIHVKLNGRMAIEKICGIIDRLKEKYPNAKIIVDLTSGVSYDRE